MLLQVVDAKLRCSRGVYNLRLELIIEHSSSRGRWRQVSSCLLSKVKASNLETVPAAFGNRKALNRLGTNWSWICTKSPAFPKFEGWRKSWVLVTASSSWRLHEDLTVVVFFKVKGSAVQCLMFGIFCCSVIAMATSTNAATGDSNDRLPLKKIPGTYGTPFFGAVRDRLDYFWFQGIDTFFKSRMDEYKSTVYRVNMPPGPPGFPDPRVIALLDQKSFPVLFDMSLVEKKDVFVGTYRPR